MTRPEISAQLEASIDAFDLFTPTGGRAIAVVIKQLFGYTTKGRVFRLPGAEIRPVDVPWPDGESAMLPSDLFLHKPSTDVVVSGSAVGPDAGAEQLEVAVRVGPVGKALLVFGPRVWYKGALGMTLTPAQAFHRLPLMWEHAWGGLDTSDPERPASEARNPVGTGIACWSDALNHQPGPRIEDPEDLLKSSKSRPKPAGVAAIGPSYEPRLSYAGTHDQKWQDERMPLPPLDFDERFNQVATPALITPSYLRGGEPVEMVNLGSFGMIRFRVPRLAFAVVARSDDETRTYRPALDTVVLRPDESQFELTYRTPLPLPRRTDRIREVLAYEKAVS